MRIGWGRALSLAGIVSLVAAANLGCALHYYDARTSTEHVVGLGYLRMRVDPSPNEPRAVVHGIGLLGASVGTTRGGAQLAVGWASESRVEILKDDTEICLEYPSGLGDVRIGADAPPTFAGCVPRAEEQTR
jgi:hypothetical protein